MNGLTAALFVMGVVITYDEVHTFNRMPCPARYLWTFALFVALALVFGTIAPGFAAVVAWAFVISVGLSLSVAKGTPIGDALTRRPKTEIPGGTLPGGSSGGKKGR
jgi:hypothetical protein